MIPSSGVITYLYVYVIIMYVYTYVISVLQFVLSMDLPSMRAEWRCITMVYGVQCVMMDGI